MSVGRLPAVYILILMVASYGSYILLLFLIIPATKLRLIDWKQESMCSATDLSSTHSKEGSNSGDDVENHIKVANALSVVIIMGLAWKAINLPPNGNWSLPEIKPADLFCS